jgi:hypothetical protein
VTRRIYAISAAFTALGLALSAWLGGKAAVVGFLVGACYSILSFRFLHGVVQSLGTDRPRAASGAFMATRFLLLGVLLYVIVKYSESSLPAALWGIFVAIAAVIVESIYQLYARTS